MRRMTIAAVTAVWVLVAVHSASAQHEGTHHESHTPAGQEPAAGGAVDHSQHERHAPELPPFIPPVTEADRQAAFPDVEGHTVHDRTLNYFVLFDQLEWQSAGDGSWFSLDGEGWVGRDRDRLWFRAEGSGTNGDVDDAGAQVFYGRQFSPWWDLVAGVGQDFQPGPSRTWAAFGFRGLAPYWFHVELTGFVGSGGRTRLRGEVEYDLLLTNRLVLQPLVEAEVLGKSDPERGLGAGLSTMEAGFRLRYELRREFAPYIGVAWNQRFGDTADFARADGDDTGGARIVAGIRVWF